MYLLNHNDNLWFILQQNLFGRERKIDITTTGMFLVSLYGQLVLYY